MTKRRKTSAATLAKMSASAKARSTPEYRAKIGATSKGRLHTAETRAKMSQSHMGKTFSAETRAKIGRANTGQKRSAEIRARMSEAQRGRKLTPEQLEQHRAVLNRPEVRAKLSAAAKALHARRRAAKQSTKEKAK